jgi:hypothetical protein
MKKRLLTSLLVAIAVVATAASATLAAKTPAQIAYVFNGRLLADAGSSSQLSVHVTGGNRAALKELMGQNPDQQFAVGSATQYLRWANGVPTVVSESNLAAGDFVSIAIRAPRGSSLAQLEAIAANRVADRGAKPQAAKRPVWLFVGTLASAADGKLTIEVKNGNHRALVAMLGQPVQQTFSYDSKTVFVLWQDGKPSVISPSQLKVGDRISIRIRAPRSDSLAQVEQVPANHVGDHEPGEPSS